MQPLLHIQIKNSKCVCANTTLLRSDQNARLGRALGAVQLLRTSALARWSYR